MKTSLFKKPFYWVLTAIAIGILPLAISILK